MTVYIACLLIVSLIAGFVAGTPWLMALFLTIACFFFSMIAIYGARAGSIGIASMIALILTVDPRLNLSWPVQVMQRALLVASGGLWYMCFSLLLYNFRPCRLAQQAMGDGIQATAAYLLLGSELFKKDNEQANALLQKRKQELQQGIIECVTRQSLIDVKSVADQFNLIYKAAAGLSKITQTTQAA